MCGVLFEAMALPAVVVVLQGIRGMLDPSAVRSPSTGSVWWLPAYSALGSVGLALGWWSFFAIA